MYHSGMYRPGKRPRQITGRGPSETSDQIMLAGVLDRTPICWAHIPNGGSRASAIEGRNLKRAGVKSGVPDIMVFDPPPLRPECHGAIIELKRTDGKPEDVSDAQTLWLDRLGRRGWATHVAFGAKDALRWLMSLGYPIPPSLAEIL